MNLVQEMELICPVSTCCRRHPPLSFSPVALLSYAENWLAPPFGKGTNQGPKLSSLGKPWSYGELFEGQKC